MKLQPNFELSEFEVSETAARFGWDNTVPEDLIPNAFKLAVVLQRIRDFLLYPVIITSGYRSAQVNRRVGGRPNSAHLQCAAADIIIPGFGPPLEVCQAIAPHVDTFGIGQLIHEYGRWVHVSIVSVAPINRIITIDLGDPAVRSGIHPARLLPGQQPPPPTGRQH